MNAHTLDRPAWSALTGGWAHLPHGDDHAWRIEPDHGPFVARRMLAQGETPFLHAYAANEGAVRLYETLGFRIRRTVRLTVVTRG